MEEGEEEGHRFNLKTIERLLKSSWQLNTKINADGVQLSGEFLRLFVVEAINRAAKVAEAEGAESIEPSHLEQILPQLLLDF